MLFETSITSLADYLLFVVCIFILFGSIFITIRMRFVQIRFLPSLFKMLFSSLFHRNKSRRYTIPPHRALFTAMSTTLGISTIVSPIIAISLGGPGALLGFLITAFFGSAATYAEVNLCIQYRKKLENGMIMGGPMQYLTVLLSPGIAKWYAAGCFILMAAWSSAQANQLAAILSSPLLQSYSISTVASGLLIVSLVMIALIGGIKRISAISARMIPVMFVLYLGSCLWIVVANHDKFWSIWKLIFDSAFQPYALASGTIVGGIVSSMRWGMFKGIQTCEAGIGTQTIPHSMAETDDPVAQGTLAMMSTYTAGLMAFLSGFVALMTETWLNPELPLGMSMVAATFQHYFSTVGIIVLVFCTFLFAFGTILGNSFNGSQCFNYLTNNKKTSFYLAGTAVIIFIGSISEAKIVWSVIDLILAGIAIPHVYALILYAYKNPSALPLPDSTEELGNNEEAPPISLSQAKS